MKTLKKQVDEYLPMLSARQQVLVLEIIKGFLNVDAGSSRISSKEYNSAIEDAVARIEKGDSMTHRNAMKELSEW